MKMLQLLWQGEGGKSRREVLEKLRDVIQVPG